MNPRLTIVAVLLVTGSCAPASQEDGPPSRRAAIIDMHLHAFEVAPGAINPGTGLRAPDTQQEYEQRVLAFLEEYDVLAVASGPLPLVRRWKAEAPDRIIPGIFFRHPSEIGTALTRELLPSGGMSVLRQIAARSEGLAPVSVALHMGTSGIDVHQNCLRVVLRVNDLQLTHGLPR